jgi:VCBS repeat protein
MRHPASTRRRVFWMVCACALLLPGFAAAKPSLAIGFDLDGDGRGDQVVLDRDRPLVLQVWLSNSGTTQVIRSRVPILQVAAADLDGDHRPELIASDGDSQLQVWTRKRKGFHSYRARHAVPSASQREVRRIDDTNAEPPGEITSPPFAPFALTLCPSARAPGLEAAASGAPHAACDFRSLTAVDPFAPRPPPARLRF